MLNTKHNLKSGENKDKKKGFQRENKTGHPRLIIFKNYVIEHFDVVLLTKQKQRRQKKN